MTRLQLRDGWLDLSTGELVRGEARAVLTPLERRLVRYLNRRAPAPVPRVELLTEVWGYRASTRTRTVENTLRRLRMKLERDASNPRHLLTVRGAGYAWRSCSADESAGPLIGREADLATIVSFLTGPTGLLSVVGPGGVGKTALAREVLRRAQSTPLAPASGSLDHVWFCELAHCRTAHQLQAEVAEALSLAPPAVPHALREERGLVVLDNLEQLTAGAVELLRAWRQACPQIHWLGTSRRPLNLEGERILPLRGLAPDGAIELLRRRAPRALDDAESSLLQRLVGQLDGLPLAIELAAARLSLLELSSLSRRLQTHLSILVDHERTGDHRHRAMEATLAGSWELLEPEEKVALSALSTFEGSFALETAEQIIGDALPPGRGLDALQALLSSSLLRPEGQVRFALSLGTKLFVRERVVPAQRARYRARHTRWARQLAERLGPRLEADPAVRDQLRRELPELNAVMAPDQAAAIHCAIGTSVGSPWSVRERLDGSRRLLVSVDDPELRAGLELSRSRALLTLGQAQEALEATAAGLKVGSDRVRSRLLLCRTACFRALGRIREARETLSEVEETAEIAAEFQIGAGNLAIAEGRFRAALETAEEAQVAALRHGRTLHMGVALSLASVARLHLAQPDRAAELARAALERLRGWPTLACSAHHNLATALHRLGHLEAAQHSYIDAIAACRHAGLVDRENEHRSNLGALLWESGDLAGGLKALDRALLHHLAAGHRRYAGLTRVNRAGIWLELGRTAEAAEELKRVLDQAGPTDPVRIYALAARGALHHARSPGRAIRDYQTGVALASRLGDALGGAVLTARALHAAALARDASTISKLAPEGLACAARQLTRRVADPPTRAAVALWVGEAAAMRGTPPQRPLAELRDAARSRVGAEPRLALRLSYQSHQEGRGRL